MRSVKVQPAISRGRYESWQPPDLVIVSLSSSLFCKLWFMPFDLSERFGHTSLIPNPSLRSRWRDNKISRHGTPTKGNPRIGGSGHLFDFLLLFFGGKLITLKYNPLITDGIRWACKTMTSIQHFRRRSRRTAVERGMSTVSSDSWLSRRHPNGPPHR